MMQHAAAAAEPHVAPHVPPPQWLPAMQYPTAMMMAPPLPRPYPHFLPYHHHHHHPHPLLPPPPSPLHPSAAAGASSDDNKTIWLGDLHYWMDETYLGNCFAHTGEVHNIKVIRNKQTGQSEGYGFVEFKSHVAAEKVLQGFNGHLMPNTDQAFRLNWATFSMGDRRSDATLDHSIFVGDLASDVTDTLLLDTFANKYSSVKGAKVVIDASTGRSKGYGFVRFSDENEKKHAMTEMNGVYCSSRPMRIGAATPRKSSVSYGSNGGATAQVSQTEGDFTNTTVFVGGLDPSVSEDDLRQAFSQYGEIASVKIPSGKQCGFVQFVHRSNAEEALQGLNPSHEPFRSTAVTGSPWNGNVFYGGQLYNGYGYAVPFQDPGIYAAPYSPYYYGNQQQVS